MADHRSLAPTNLPRQPTGLSSPVQTAQTPQDARLKNVSGVAQVTGPAPSKARAVMFGGPKLMAGPLAMAKGLAPRKYGGLALLASLRPGLAAYVATLPQVTVATMPPLPLTPVNRATRGYITARSAARGATRLGTPVDLLSLNEPELPSGSTPGSASKVTKSLTEREAMSQVTSAMAPVETQPLPESSPTTLGEMARAYLDPQSKLSRQLMMAGVVGGIR